MLLVRKLCQGANSENILTFRRVWIFSQLGEIYLCFLLIWKKKNPDPDVYGLWIIREGGGKQGGFQFGQSAKLCVIGITLKVDAKLVENVTKGGRAPIMYVCVREVMGDRWIIAVGRDGLVVAVITIETEELQALRWYGGD